MSQQSVPIFTGEVSDGSSPLWGDWLLLFQSLAKTTSIPGCKKEAGTISDAFLLPNEENTGVTWQRVTTGVGKE
eukprot:scaffold718_cov252-Pinguiococcus_pyrenoidosus.AAC.8